MPISNAEIERTFSSFTYIKNKYRNRLIDENCDNLLFVFKLKISQEKFSKEYIDDAIRKWMIENNLRFV